LTKVEVNKRNSFTGHREPVYALQPGDGQHFYSAAGDGLVVQWNLGRPEEGELIARLPKSVYALLFLPTKNQLVAAQNFSGIHLLDPIGKKEIASLQLTSSYIFDLKLLGENLLVATGDGELITVDLHQWRVIRRERVSDKSLRAIAVNEKSREFAVGSSDNLIRIFDSETRSLKKEISAHNNSVFALSYTPDQSALVSGSRDAHLKIWDVQNDYQLTSDVAAHYFAINDIRFSPNGQYFATGSMDKSIKLWKTVDFQLLKVIDKSRHAGHGTSVNKLLWTSPEGILLSASDDRSISAWDLLFL
jgi:WD40 repeat protein